MIRGIGGLTVYSRIILLVQPPVKELPTFPFLGFYSHNVTARHGIKKEAPSCAWRKNTSLGIWDLVFIHLFDPRFNYYKVLFSLIAFQNLGKRTLWKNICDRWIPDWFPKVEKEESRKWEPVDGIQEKIICLQHFVFLFIYELET